MPERLVKGRHDEDVRAPVQVLQNIPRHPPREPKSVLHPEGPGVAEQAIPRHSRDVAADDHELVGKSVLLQKAKRLDEAEEVLVRIEGPHAQDVRLPVLRSWPTRILRVEIEARVDRVDLPGIP